MKKSNSAHLSHQQIQELSLLAMFTAIILLLAFTPIGLIDLPFIKATILHVPVILGAILLGPKKGAFLGGVFGVVSLIKNTLTPSALSFAFSPFIAVPGLGHGSVWALAICFVPRILVGVIPWLIDQQFKEKADGKLPYIRTVGITLAGAAGAVVNTSLVMGLIFLIFRDSFALLRGIPVNSVLGVILGIVAANGIPEAVVAAVLVPAISIPLMHYLKLRQTTFHAAGQQN